MLLTMLVKAKCLKKKWKGALSFKKILPKLKKLKNMMSSLTFRPGFGTNLSERRESTTMKILPEGWW